MLDLQPEGRSSARATATRREFEDVVASLKGAWTPELTMALTNIYDLLPDVLGPVLALSNQQKLSVAALLAKHSRSHARSNAAKASACAIVALHLKALAIPGTDADYVIGATQEMIMRAFAERKEAARIAA
jgi:hypothetical protein